MVRVLPAAQITIRPAILADAPGLTACSVQAWRETYIGLLSAEKVEEVVSLFTEERSYKIIESNKLDMLVAIATTEAPANLSGKPNSTAENGATREILVGYVGVVVDPDEDGNTEVRTIYLLNAWQRRGIASELFEKGLAGTKGGPVKVVVMEGNDRAIGFYRAMGFGE